jgi:hypothetical protein
MEGLTTARWLPGFFATGRIGSQKESGSGFHAYTLYRIVELVLLLTLMAAVATGCSSGTSSSAPPAPNPFPIVKAISPTVLAAGAPATQVTVTGSGFVNTSEVLVGNVTIPTTLISATELQATIPAANLGTSGTLQVAVENPSPGGGTSAAMQINVVSVTGFVVFASPATAGQTDGPWVVGIAASSSSSKPVEGLPVTINASVGTLSATSGTTDVNGDQIVTFTPPSGVSTTQQAVITATTGAQAATVDFSFAPLAASQASALGNLVQAYARRHTPKFSSSSPSSTQPAPATYYSSPFVMGSAGSPGTQNVFSNPGVAQCLPSPYTSYQETSITSNCQGILGQANVTNASQNLDATACHDAKIVSTLVGVGECAGAVAITAGCIASVVAGGVGAVLCEGALGGVQAALGIGCFEFIGSIIANELSSNAGRLYDVAEVSVAPLGIANAGFASVNLICSFVPPPVLTNPICPSGSTCLFVANAGSNTISVFDPSGNSLSVPASAFPNLDGPDGMVYDPADGDLYVTNLGNNTVTIYDPDGNQVASGSAFSNLPSIAGNAEDIVLDKQDGNFYINDTVKNQVYEYNSNGVPVSLPAGAFPNLNEPFGVFFNPMSQLIYVANSGNNTINAYTTSGTPVPLSGTFAGLQAPDDFVLDKTNGDFFVTESEGSFGSCIVSGIAEFDSNGNPITPSGGFSTVDCPDSIAILNTPLSTIAPQLLYVTNVVGNSVTVYDANGYDVTAQAAPGGFSGLDEPTGIVIVSN